MVFVDKKQSKINSYCKLSTAPFQKLVIINLNGKSKNFIIYGTDVLLKNTMGVFILDIAKRLGFFAVAGGLLHT